MRTLTTPFTWNGTDNIVVDTAFSQVMPTYSSSGTVRYYSLTNGFRFAQSDGADQTNIFSGGGTSSYKPQIKMAFQVSDTTPPTITSVSSNKANGSYKAGDVIDINVTFSENVSSTGNVLVTLETGVIDRTCTFTVSNATSGSCNYTVQDGDVSADLDNVSLSGTIKDQANNAMVNFVPATSLAVNKNIVIDTIPPSTPISSPAGGTYTSVQSITLSSSGSSAIYYTTDNSTPTTNSMIYSSSLAVNTSMTIKALGVDAAGNQSPVLTAAYVINLDPNAPVITNISAVPSASDSVILWKTNEDASSLVEYGLVSSYGNTTSETDITTRVASHSVVIYGLKPCVRYYYRVKSKDASGNEGISNQGIFNTTGCAASTISGGNETAIATSGGTLSLSNGNSTSRLNIPNNFASESATFQLNILDTSSLPTPPQGVALVKNNFYDLVAVSGSNAVISSFTQPVDFVVSYGSDVESSYIESTLDIYKYSGGAWVKKNCILDAITNTLTCSLSSFSVYGVFGKTAGSSSPTSSAANAVTSSVPSAPSCQDQIPVGVPELFEIDTTKDTAMLYVTPVRPVTEYVVQYGIGNTITEYSGKFVSNQTEGVVPLMVASLTPNTTYTFSVRAGNGCATGNWSNTKTATTTRLQASYGEIEKVTFENDILKNCSYTIKPNDTLWIIAKETLGDGSLYKTIIAKNKEKYPKIETSLKVGTVLDLPCGEELSIFEQKEMTYSLKIKATARGQPLTGATVELHGNSQTAVTDPSGIVLFSDIAKGTYTIKLTYQGNTVEQQVIVDGNKEDHSIVLNIVMRKNIFLSVWFLSAGIFFVVMNIIVMIIFLKMPRRKRQIIMKKIYKNISRIGGKFFGYFKKK